MAIKMPKGLFSGNWHKKKVKEFGQDEFNSVINDIKSGNAPGGWESMSIGSQKGYITEQLKARRGNTDTQDGLLNDWLQAKDEHLAEVARQKQLETTKERLKIKQRERQAKEDYWAPPRPSNMKDQKYFEDVFQNGQDYYNEVFSEENIKKFNREKNSQQRRQRQQRVDNNLEKQNRQRASFETQRNNVIERTKKRINGIDGMDYSDDDLIEMFNNSMKDKSFRNGDPMSQVNNLTEQVIRKTAQNNIDAAEASKRFWRKNEVPTMEDEVSRLQNQVKENLKSNRASKGGGENTFNFDNASKGAQFAFNRAERMNEFYRQNSKSLTNEDIKKRALGEFGSFGLSEDNYADFASNKGGFRDSILSKRANSAGLNPTMMDNMWGNKVPQIAGGALITAGLVSSLSNSRGQQSNAALYGQQQQYYY